jgi:PAS domain S-box-containing protein
MHTRPERDDLAHTRQETEELERQLQESRERLQLIEQAANIGIFEWNIQSGVITWTQETEALYGLKPGSFGGDFAAWERCVHPDDLPEARKQVFEAVEKKINLDIQFRVIWPTDGSAHWIYAKGRTFYDKQGKPLRMIGINIDITERKKYEEDLHLTEERLRLFAESDIIGVIFCNVYGDIFYANDAYLQMLGYGRAEFNEKGMRWTDVTPPEWRLRDRREIEDAQHGEGPRLYEKQYIRKDGSRIDVLVGYLLMGERREQAVAFVLDITERKKLERQKDEFIGVVSHELRTPLTSVKVFAQILHKRFTKAGDHQNADLLAKMDTQIDKLTKVIGDLIDVTKMEAGKLELHETEFDLASLTDEIIEEIQRTTARHAIAREGSLEKRVRADRDRIGQVLTNLLSNAIKYSPCADTIVVRISSDGEQAIVQVQDFGVGIPREKQEQIFQRFYRVGGKNLETISGLGLGLYISAEMVRRHGGDIWFESEPGHGATFSFKIPLQRKASEIT